MPWTLKATARVLAWTAAAAALAASFALLFFWWLFRETREVVASVEFAPDVEIQLLAIDDFDVGSTLTYEVLSSGRPITLGSGAWLGLAPWDSGISLDVHQGVSADGSVVGIWSPASASDVFVLYHRPSGESWPGLRDDESRSMPEVMSKWRARYALLRQRHPELPTPADKIGH